VTRLARWAAACLVLASLTPTAGCSIVFVRRPKTVAPGQYEAGNCTTSRWPPAIDAALAAVQGGNVIRLLASDSQSDQGTSLSDDAALPLSAALVATFTSAAIYGFITGDKCRALRGAPANPANPYQQPAIKQTRWERQSEEATEEAAVQARIQEQAAADAKAAGEAARRAARPAPPAGPAKAP